VNIQQLTREAVPALPQFSVTPEAEQVRNELVLTSRLHASADTVTEANSVGEAARDIRTFIKATRDLGINLRRPLKAAAERIKAIEDDYLMPLEAEQGRLESLVSAWHAAEQRRVAEAERVRQAEIRRIMAAEDEARRLATASDAPEDIKAAQELSAAATASVEAALYAPKPEAVKVGGMVTKREMRIEVIDMHKVYQHNATLVKLELNRAAVKATCFPEHPVPGLKLWWEDSTSTRKW